MSQSPLKIALLGAAGRMGQALIQQISASDQLALASALVRRESDAYGRDAGQLAGLDALGLLAGTELHPADVLIDFSSSEVLEHRLAECVTQQLPVVSGTTALSASAEAALRDAAAHIPVLWAPNMSLGVALLDRLCREAAQAVGVDADIEIVEMHHRNKVDAPSGTALALARSIAAARSQNPAVINSNRSGAARREPGEIGVAALRGGDVVGDHTVHIALDGERLSLTHRSGSRRAFADGALRAARWLTGQPPGLYGLPDVLKA
ncbi:MAG: 4-hydroxy-tetrahydrodipicolinate reductase [Pseudomonadota bacterium]